MTFSNRKFGVEIEVVSPEGYTHPDVVWEIIKYQAKKNGLDEKIFSFDGYTNTKSWGWCDDASIQKEKVYECSLEIVSPILQGIKGINEAKKVIETIKEVGCTVNKSCGLHVHVDATKDAIRHRFAVVSRYAHIQNEAYKLVAPNRKHKNSCQRIELDYLLDVQYAQYFLDDITNAETKNLYSNNKEYKESFEEGKVYGTDHHDVLSLSENYPTYEYRAHHGSLNATEVEHWIKFCTNFTDESIKFCKKIDKVNHHKVSWKRDKNLFLDYMKNNVRMSNMFSGLSKTSKQYLENKLNTRK